MIKYIGILVFYSFSLCICPRLYAQVGKNVTLAQQDDAVYVALRRVSGDGSSGSPWVGWEFNLATNPTFDVNGVPNGCTGNICNWPPGIKYYLQAGHYTLNLPVVLGDKNSKLIGAGKFITQITYNPSVDGTAAFTLGATGVAGGIAALEISGITLQSTSTNTHSKIGFFIIDGEEVVLRDNIVTTWHGPGAVGLYFQGREFLFAENNVWHADNPVFLQGSQTAGAPLNNIGVSKFVNEYYFGCTVTSPCVPHSVHAWGDTVGALIAVDPNTYLTDVQFSGSSMVGGTNGFVWTGTPAVRSERVLIENIRWEQMSDMAAQANGWFINIFLVGGQDLVGLTVRNAGYAPAVTPVPGALGGIQLGNVHQVHVDTVTNIGAQSGAFLSLTNAYPVSVENSFATPGNIPVYNGGICNVYKTPQTTAFIGGFQNALPTGGKFIADLPADSTLCLAVDPWSLRGSLTNTSSTASLTAFTVSFNVGKVILAIEGATKHEMCVYQVGTAAVVQESGTTNCDTAGGAGKIGLVRGGATDYHITNNLGETVQYVLTIDASH